MAEELAKQGFYLAGDSAYALMVFLLTPYDNAGPRSTEDTFNFFHSSCRIFIECAFGELVMRWGIFWRKIAFSARKVGRIVQAAMLLHNFIVNEREQSSSEATIDRNFFEKFEYDETERNRRAHGDAPNALVSDNEEPKPKGRLDKRKEELKESGSKLRETLSTNLATKGYVRPLQTGMKYNSSGHVYMEY